MLTVTEFKMGFTKSNPSMITYWDYKKFNNNAFFRKTIFRIFNKHAPIKEKCLCGNETPFMTNKLHVAIMKRSRLKNKFLREKNQANRTITKFSATFAKNQKFFGNIDTKKNHGY